jgi:hypothetical protein
VAAQTGVYTARGMLVESTKPFWLYGTSSEHSTFYQYAFNKAKNVHAAMIRTESPYYQSTPKPPAPFTSGKISADPDYNTCKNSNGKSGCDSSWVVILKESSDISIAEAGLYSWFNKYDESCVDPRTCQKSLIYMENNGPGIQFLNLVRIFALYTIFPHFSSFLYYFCPIQ